MRPVTAFPADEPARESAGHIAAGLAKLALVFRHEAWRSAGEHGLPPTQAQIVATVAGSASPLGLGELADRLALTPGTVSAAVTALVDKGLLHKRRSSADARAIVLGLTPEGRRHAAAAGDWPESVLAAVCGLDDRDRAGLLRGLSGLLRNLQQRGAVPLARMCVECSYFRPNAHHDAQKPHHCAFMDAPIGESELRLDCAEMQPAADDIRPRLYRLMVEGRSL